MAAYCPLVVEYYISVADEHNHVVREAACHCIAELATKVEKTAVIPFVSELLGALMLCFEDESWPVRDAACVATGQFVLYVLTVLMIFKNIQKYLLKIFTKDIQQYSLKRYSLKIFSESFDTTILMFLILMCSSSSLG